MGMFSLFHILILVFIFLLLPGIFIGVPLAVYFLIRSRNTDHGEKTIPREDEVRSYVTSCPDCGMLVARSAASCPNCGRPLKSDG